MTEVIYLGLDDVLALVRGLRAGPVRDVGLLDSAVARCASTAFGEDAYPTMELKAAALLHSIAGNHALVDGNKRLAWLATTVFLDANGLDAGLDDDTSFDLVMDVATGRADVGDIAARLRLRPAT